MNKAFDKIIEKLEEAKSNVPVNRLLDDIIKDKPKELGQLMAYNKAIEIVKQEAEEYNNGWIPCSERLPKYGEVVMCSCTNSGITISCITHKGVKPSKSVRFGQHSVIAWQPLPQPYQTKGE